MPDYMRNPIGNKSIWGRLRGAVAGIPFPNTYALLDDAGCIGGLGPFKQFYLDPVNGDDTYDGRSPSSAVKTLAVAYALLTDGKNDTLHIIGNGLLTGALYQNTSFTWAKNATHLVGDCSPVLFSQRATIRPALGTTAALVNPFFTISGSGCIFKNIQWCHELTTGATAQLTVVVTGSRNYFGNCHFAGMVDATSAGSTTSRSLKIGGSGSGENVFEDCVVGVDTVARGVANASLEFVGGAVRNVFRRCVFPFQASAAGVLGIITSAAACLDRETLFEDCWFVNGIGSTATQMDAIATLAASAGGVLAFVNPRLIGITGFGTAAGSRAQIYIFGVADGSTTTGIGYNPSA